MATPQEIASDASCFACVPDKQAAMLYLLATIAGVTDPQTIATGAACYACIPDKSAAMLYLLDSIATGGGAGGGGAVTCSASSDPAGAPSGSCGIHYRLDTGQMWFWNSGTAAWDLIL